jgi:hypothetical protein
MAKKIVKPFSDQGVYKEIKTLVDQATSTDTRNVFTKLVKGNLSRAELIDAMAAIPGNAFNRVSTIIDTGLSVVGRERINDVAQDLGLTWYRYIGGVIRTSREFCIERDGGYYNQAEIEAWSEEDWEGKIEGTNTETIFSYCGGYNCRHELIPVLENSVPEEYKQAFADSKVKLTEEADNFNELPPEDVAPAVKKIEIVDDQTFDENIEVINKRYSRRDVNGVKLNDEGYTINVYTRDGFEDVNQVLFGNTEATVLSDAIDQNLYKALSKLPPTASPELYRVESFNPERLKGYLSGKPWTNKGYLSTAYRKDSSFFPANFDNVNTRLRIKVIPKTQGVGKQIQEFSGFNTEYEVLFPKQTLFETVSYDEANRLLTVKEL